MRRTIIQIIMKLQVILTAVFSMIFTTAVFAQEVKTENVKTVNFSGNWILDIKKSKLNEKLPVESMTMKVIQTGKDLKIETDTKYTASAEKKLPGQRGSAGLDSTISKTNTVYNYTIGGKEADYQEPDGIGNAKIIAEIEKNGQLKLIQTRRFNMQTGDKVLKTIEIWTLSPDGKTLTVKRSKDALKGDFIEKILVSEASEMVFTKKI